ncbi:glycosidase/chitodextrinase [Fontibacillus solani]|uniref:Glycosidase/chitodextrinase n=1 Tax=Fontibacillus solani TaxID=1572857 RepID=A0A7W3SR71_9BACL|nr:glycosidase/chitodextrinase [Fontibacillus solani]
MTRRFVHLKKWNSLILCITFFFSFLGSMSGSTSYSIAAAAESESTSGNEAIVYYYTPYKNWSSVNIHHNGSGAWTTAPGVAMEAACTNWTKATISLGSTSSFQAVFNNGSGAWDNNGGNNYSLTSGIHQVKDGQFFANAGNPCGQIPDDNTVTVYYKSNASWPTVNIHYSPTGGAWTTAPGVAMDEGCSLWKKKTIALGSATGLTAAFNNGSTWDNNGGKNYLLGTGDIKVESGIISSGNPCGISEDEPPTIPTDLTQGTVTSTSAMFSWTASTDNVGVTGYDVYRNSTLIQSNVTSTSYTDSGLTASTTYSYTVLAKDAAGNQSPQSAPLQVTTSEAPDDNIAQIYYNTKTRGWGSANIHYQINGSAWTTAPGVNMNDAGCTNWAAKSINLGTATGLKAAFNNGSGAWDNNGGSNYTIGAGITTIKDGVVTLNAASPCTPDTTPPSVPTGLSKGAVTSASAVISWTASTDNVGVTGYDVYRNGNLVKAGVTTTSYTDTGLTASTTYSYTVLAKDAAGNQSAQSTALQVTTADPTSENTAEIYYYTKTRGWSSVNIHYQINGSTWTTAPGEAMEATSCTDWKKKKINLGTATGVNVVFNNGNGAWDNHGGVNYSIGPGITTIKDGVVTANTINPCIPPVPDTTPPSVPTNVSAIANGIRIALTWTASIDNEGGRGVAGYEITRTGGTQGTKVFISATNSYADSGLDAQTVYTYSVAAYDKAEPSNKSASSASVSAKTGDAPTPLPGGEPIGTDMREDSIYFVMTARFYDGDSSNNRGGQFHVSSGNAANNDPMFRGDFKGLIEKLDYIKALGFSAIWITPVVLNRSDYDFHGYHGWDFYRVDPRLESEGASYQELINEAHNKGIKIIQDVVYNHSSRWGEKNLFSPTVYGVQDSQWNWYYDTPVPGKEYDGLNGNDPMGKAYNGDIWSTEEPAGNTCRNWGQPTSFYSKEGYRIYNCQWPNPTSGMFPSELFHQCWIGNWEGEDSRSCWIHEDLADFNTENQRVQDFLKEAYRNFIDMGVDGFRIDTAVHVPRTTWNREFLPDAQNYAAQKFGDKGKNFFMFGEVGSFVNDKWNRGSVNHSAQFFTWKERKQYSADDAAAALEMYQYENSVMGTANQPTSTNAFMNGNNYHTPDHSQFSGMNVIDMRMHMNFSDAGNAFWNGKDSDDSYNDATYNVVYVDSHDYGPNKSGTRYTGGTAAWAENMSLMWTFRGIPTLFYGSEIEFKAGAKIDCGPTCPLETTGRAYFGDNIEGTVVASDFGVVQSATGQVAQTLNHPLVKHVQRLNQIRRKIPALQKGQYSTEGVSGNIAYKRRFTDTAKGVDSFALVTVSSSATFTGIPNGIYKDAVTGDVKNVNNGTLTATVSGKGNLRVYVQDLPNNPAPGKIGVDGAYLK